MIDLNKDYWTTKYEESNIGWDTGGITTPLKTYFDQLTDKSIRILIPGCGNGYEAEYLHNLGFNVTVIDLSEYPLKKLKERCVSFPGKKLIQGNFFGFEGQFDLIIEQTFFSALNPSLRNDYAKQMNKLLAPQGKLVGLLFNIELYHDHPPFGGNKELYKSIFEPYFKFNVFEEAYNSIEPRKGNELFLNLARKNELEE
ncbi:MAG: TPMT family class I SAM-dependent methyltransferase [Cyclobacteriaceae bacterium]|nr:TPMT family class I SAM-dependent methyltransferase [Cyclobacteriaceae bacterium]